MRETNLSTLFQMLNRNQECRINILKFYFTLVIWLIHVLSLTGQNDSLRLFNNLVLGAGLHYGSVLPHHESIEYSLESNIGGLEITIGTDTYGRSPWDELYRYPRMGAGYLLTSLGNRHVFGRANAVFLFMDFPFSSKQKKLITGYQINFGVSYLNKIYNVVDNPLNMAISTGLNVYACFRVNAKYFINAENELFAGFGFSHFSNGKVTSPNLGINIGSFVLGYRNMISAPRYTRISGNNFNWQEKHSGEVILSGGAKTDDQITGKTYLISTLICDYRYNFSKKYAAGAGTDLFYDPTLGPNMVYEQGGTYSNSDLIQFGIHGTLFARYSRLNVVGNVGVYLFARYFKYSLVYSRIGFRYEINRHILLNLSLKAHYAIADYIELGIGYRL